MSDFVTKHDFVDDYPYIAYTPKADTAITGNESSLPVASADTLGGVKVGSGLSITEEGVLSASGGGGGGDVLVVNFEYTEEVEYTNGVKADKTFEEVQTAYDNGTPIYGTFVDSNVYYWLVFSAINKNASPYKAQFRAIRSYTTGMELLEITMTTSKYNISADYKDIVTE